jgi:hypothetical protein
VVAHLGIVRHHLQARRVRCGREASVSVRSRQAANHSGDPRSSHYLRGPKPHCIDIELPNLDISEERSCPVFRTAFIAG